MVPLLFCSRLGVMALRMSCLYTKSTDGMRAKMRGTGPGDRNHAMNAARAAGAAAKATTAQLLSIYAAGCSVARPHAQAHACRFVNNRVQAVHAVILAYCMLCSTCLRKIVI
jgi:hypothetical protein